MTRLFRPRRGRHERATGDQHAWILSSRTPISDAQRALPSWFLIDKHTIVEVGRGKIPRRFANLHHQEEAGSILPGFVDIHSHGAMGFDFGTASADEARQAVEFHNNRGTTSIMASVASASADDTINAIRRLRPLVEDGTLCGIHLEGPYLARDRRGAHALDVLRTPDSSEMARIIHEGRGTVRMVTIAPELPEAMSVIQYLRQVGVVVAIGHTACDAQTAAAAFEAGARVATHLFNGMAPLHHRNPGPVGAALADPRVIAELIVDGHHLADETIEMLHEIRSDRVVLISDSMAATGVGPGKYTIAGSDVVVEHGVALTVDSGSLAGSTITVSDSVERLVSLGRFTLADIAQMTSGTPRKALGSRSGARPGSTADLVVIDPMTGRVQQTLKGGVWAA